MYLQAQAQVAQVDQGDGRAPEALLLQQLLCLQPLPLRLSPPYGCHITPGFTGHPEGLVLPVRQTGEDLLTQIGEVVLVSPLEVAGLEMLLIPETIESKYYDIITNQKDKERHVREERHIRGERTVVWAERCPEAGQYQDELR